jgi:hypothetical protein
MVSHQVQKEAEEKMKKRHLIIKMHDLLIKELEAVDERLPVYTKVHASHTALCTCIAVAVHHSPECSDTRGKGPLARNHLLTAGVLALCGLLSLFSFFFFYPGGLFDLAGTSTGAV